MQQDQVETITDVHLKDALSERYLAYAMSTIMSRSLPDVRDGLKPVHRRLIYAMHQLRLDPSSGFKKCARVVGDVIGKYHPHGDASVYETLVRLAQDFAVRYPLIDGQGNFGSIDGDNAAAMRYTESRLTWYAMILLEGISEDAVDFRFTYDGEEQEPMVLPGGFPNLLANGAAGIAVGMATSIPPHNVIELCDAALHLIRNPHISTQELLTIVPGPDFPTGGQIIESKDSLLQSYETGRGSFRVRAQWVVEQTKFATWRIVVSNIPYQVQKSRLIEQIAMLMEQKKLPLLGDIRDESATDIRIILEPKNRSVDPEVLMETLFRATALESRYPLNMNVLDLGNIPKVMGLKAVLQSWLNHRQEVLIRRSQYRLSAVQRRLEVLEGYITVYINLDDIITIIRDTDDPHNQLISQFKLTERQVDAILNMRLRSLRRLEEENIRTEISKLSTEVKDLQALVCDNKLQWKSISEEISNIKKSDNSKIEGKRRTKVSFNQSIIDISSSISVEKDPLTIFLSRHGWIKAVKGHQLDIGEQRFKEGDDFSQALECTTADKLCLFTTDGKIFTLKVADLPRGRGDGQSFRLMIDIPTKENLVSIFVLDMEKSRLVVSETGKGFVVKEVNLVAEKRIGKRILNLKPGDRAVSCVSINGDMVAITGGDRKLLIFSLDQLPIMLRGSGIILQKYKNERSVGGVRKVQVFSSTIGLVWGKGGRSRSIDDLKTWIGKRADIGKTAPMWAWKNP